MVELFSIQFSSNIKKIFEKLIHWFKKYCLYSAAIQAEDRKHNVTITYLGFGTNHSGRQQKIAYNHHTRKVWTDIS